MSAEAEGRRCANCGKPMPADAHHRAKNCSPACMAAGRRRSGLKAWRKWRDKTKEADK